jgi:tetratricopeptide (TPR) repeat protein
MRIPPFTFLCALTLFLSLASPLTAQTTTAADFYLRGYSKFDSGQYDAAIADLTKAIELGYSKVGDAYYFRAGAYYFKKNLKAAADDITKAIDLDTRPKTSYWLRGEIRYAAEDLDGAIADFTKSLEHTPNDFNVYDKRSLARWRKGDLAGAAADTTKAIELDPKNPFLYVRRGAIYDNMKREDLAQADFHYVTMMKPKIASIHIAVGRWRLARKDRNTIYSCSLATESEPDNPEAWLFCGEAWLQIDRLDQAIIDFNKALELKPNLADAYFGRGLARRQKREFESAIADLTKSIELSPTHAGGYGNRALAYNDTSRHADALADLTKAISLTGIDSHWQYVRGWTNLYIGRNIDAHQDISLFLSKNELKDHGAYAPTVAYIALRKSGKVAEVARFLKIWSPKIDRTSWPGRIFTFMNGEMTAASLLELADDDEDKLTEAHTFIGEKLLIAGDQAGARKHFQWVVEHGKKDFFEYRLAVVELNRLAPSTGVKGSVTPKGKAR